MKFKYLIIVLSVSGTLLLYLLTMISQPTTISLSTLSHYEGKQVRTQGIVTAYRTTSFGSQLITIRDTADENNATSTVYLEGALSVEYGDTIQVTGTVQRYNGEWELAVDNPKYLTITQKWNNISFPLWQLAEHPTRYLNTNVNVTGIIETISGSTFILTDIDGKYSLLVYPESSHPTLTKGDTITVEAQFQYDANNVRYILRSTTDASRISVLTHGGS